MSAKEKEGGVLMTTGIRAEKSNLNDLVREVKEEGRWHSVPCS